MDRAAVSVHAAAVTLRTYPARALLCIAALATARCSDHCDVCDGAATTHTCTFGNTDVTITPIGASAGSLTFDGTASITTTAPLTIAASSFSLVVTPNDTAHNLSIGDNVSLEVAGNCASSCNVALTVRDSISANLLLAAWDTNSDDGLTVDDWQVSYVRDNCTGITQQCGVAVSQSLAVTRNGHDAVVPAGDSAPFLIAGTGLTVINGQSLIHASKTCTDADDSHFAGAIVPNR